MKRVKHVCTGCHQVVDVSPCEKCKKARDLKMESDPDRIIKKKTKYGPEFRAKRKEWVAIMADETVLCARCNLPVNPANFHLDHVDGRLHPRFKGGALHPSHPKCNMRAGGRLGKRKR